ncbi:hypothetical protein CAPTEDRAFT_111738 [Capitella teleta]|uniref:Plasminogen receptor (KT) n=1 Tax=Capitella teleta TaxID=283909 RepID=X1YV59_CAPTE|nr:hypothetical protein CAPTEDRAFT_111738 [Capitella teleta]|eukprot:ELU04655.1 hypothetical protein CAPTEDRAFT_111738 [Capitella teleta]
MERQMQMQNYMRELQMSMQLARARDLFHWFGSFYALTLVGGVAGFMKQKSPKFLAPLVPLTFIFGYQYDMAYGSKMDRIRNDARYILDEQVSMLDLPKSLPSLAVLDERRQKK